jgi:hypothetical protein
MSPVHPNCTLIRVYYNIRRTTVNASGVTREISTFPKHASSLSSKIPQPLALHAVPAYCTYPRSPYPMFQIFSSPSPIRIREIRHNEAGLRTEEAVHRNGQTPTLQTQPDFILTGMILFSPGQNPSPIALIFRLRSVPS